MPTGRYVRKSFYTHFATEPSDVSEKMKALERENRELQQANEILRKASDLDTML